MKTRFLLCLCFLTALTMCGAAQTIDDSRYPYRIPDWLWQDERHSALVDAKVRKELEYDIQVLSALQKLKDQSAADQKDDEISVKLGKLFSLRDLTADALIVTDPTNGLKLAVQIDPALGADARRTLSQAIPLYLRFALDEGVIRKSLETSVDDPVPMPAMYEMKDGQPIVDEFGHKVYTQSYTGYLKRRHRPADVVSFQQHLKSALSTPQGDPALLIISRYTGGEWWGGGYYNFFYTATQHLTKDAPAHGYLYIRLNDDKFKAGVPGWNDPRFWASKLSHEILHNLNYWHPNYKDPVERDANNQGKTRAFMVAYEMNLYEKLLQP